jgi:uncharacterized protein YggE
MKVRVALATSCFVAAVAAAGASAAATPRTITVSGTGIINTVPNQAAFIFGVTTTAQKAQAALSANAVRMNRVVDVLKQLGIRPAQLQTAQIALTPETNQSGSAVLDYSASNTVTATNDDIGKAGAIIDAAVAAGANLVSGPSLTPSDQLELSRKALTAAIADARARALTIAAAAGVKLGPVETVTENSSTVPPIFSSVAAKAPSASTPVEPGTVQTEEDLTVTFGIA